MGGFVDHSKDYIDVVKSMCKKYNVNTNRTRNFNGNAFLSPTIVNNVLELSEYEKSMLYKSYYSLGVAYFKLSNFDEIGYEHSLLMISSQLEEILPLKYPVIHPLESAAETIKIFGKNDGTAKIYNSKLLKGQALSNEQMDFHQDGLGSGGGIETVALFLDSPPSSGGNLLFQNIVLLSFELAFTDREAFDSLFLPDAITILRPNGYRSIKIVSPVLYLNQNNQPACLFRSALSNSDEYVMYWKRDNEPLNRAMSYLNNLCTLNAYGVVTLPFSEIGEGCFINNNQVLHSRTSFSEDRNTRLVSRKWFSSRLLHDFTHFPGIFISKKYRSLYPDITKDELFKGEWRFDKVSGENIRHL